MKNNFESVHDSIPYFNRVGKNVQGQENECCAAARTAEMDKATNACDMRAGITAKPWNYLCKYLLAPPT